MIKTTRNDCQHNNTFIMVVFPTGFPGIELPYEYKKSNNLAFCKNTNINRNSPILLS